MSGATCQAFGDHLSPGLQAFQNLPQVPDGGGGLQEAQAGEILLIDDKRGRLALLVMADGVLRHQNAVRVHALIDHGANIETRKQEGFGIGEWRAATAPVEGSTVTSVNCNLPVSG
jgi:hypothetical protein